MKDLVGRLEDIMNEFFDTLKNKKEDSVKVLEDFKYKLQNEINSRLDVFYRKEQLNILAQNKEVKKQQKKYLIGFWRMITHISIRYLISMPFIYSMIIPAVVLDIFLEIYHRICFPLYGIPYVKRSEYFVLDRQLLSYLNWFEKLNCLYCSYFNNLIGYCREVAGRTERYWCPIKHARRLPDPHPYYDEFAEYLDGEDFRKKYANEKCFTRNGENNIVDTN